MITDLIQVTDITSEYIIYIEPQYLRNSSHKRDMKSDIYSLGILLWEMSSGRPPFIEYTQKALGLIRIERKILNGEKEKSVAGTPLEYLQLYQKCWQDDPNLRPEINEVYEILSKLKLQSDINKEFNTQVTDDKNLSSTDNDNDEMSFPYNTKITLEISEGSAQKMIKQFKLNHGIILNEYDIIPSVQGVAVEDGELEVNLYEGDPLIYTSINSEDNELKIDTCISFPVAEIVYNGNLLKSFSEYSNDEKKLHELYGDFLARKFLVGGQLFIEDFNLATKTQADILKFYLYCIYNSVKYSTEIQYSNLFTLNLLPKLVTLSGEKIDNHEKLINWMNDLYQNKVVNIISYDDLIPISRLKDGTSADEDFEEKQPGIANFKEMLDFEDWAGDAADNNLMGWTEDYSLFQGLIVNKDDEIEISEKIAIDFTKIPKVNLRDKSYLEMLRPSTTSEVGLISGNIFSVRNLNIFPFTRNNPKAYEGYHVLIKCEQYEILLNENDLRPTQEFEQVIEEALNSMKPLKSLQDIFNEYGHLFSLRIILGGFLKHVLQDLPSDITFDDINNGNNKILESLDKLNISYLLTQIGRPIEKNDLLKWIQNHLEVVEYDKIIPLYKILKTEQQERINDLLQNNYKILMTGITDLTDLNNNNLENYKRINFDLSMESEDYEVFGLIISENNKKLEEIYVNFGLYDFNGFYAIVKKGKRNIDITKYYVLWIIIGKPSNSLRFSPKNRDFQVNYLKKSVKLKSNKSTYHIKTPFPLYEGYTIFTHTNHSSINYESNNIIKLINWKEGSIKIQVESTFKFESSANSESSSDSDFDNVIDFEIDIYICIISTNHENLKIDNNGKEYPLNLIGYTLTKENFSDNESGKNEVFGK
jgi:hypothetical protein